MTQRDFTVHLATWAEHEDALRSIRLAVFVDEQRIDIGEEFDNIDPVCRHMLALDGLQAPIGTCRVEDNGKIGRMAVLKAWRNRGVGRALLQEAIELARRVGHSRVYLNAQVSALEFYGRLGFRAYGERFFEAGIEHSSMDLEL